MLKGFIRPVQGTVFLIACAIAFMAASVFAVAGSAFVADTDSPQYNGGKPLFFDEEAEHELLELDLAFTSSKTAGSSPITLSQAGELRGKAAKAAKQLAKERIPTGPTTFGGPWTQIGANPVVQGLRTPGAQRFGAMSGRIGALAIRPSNGKFILGAAQGGIWLYDPVSGTWSAKTGDQTTQSIGSSQSRRATTFPTARRPAQGVELRRPQGQGLPRRQDAQLRRRLGAGLPGRGDHGLRARRRHRLGSPDLLGTWQTWSDAPVAGLERLADGVRPVRHARLARGAAVRRPGPLVVHADDGGRRAPAVRRRAGNCPVQFATRIGPSRNIAAPDATKKNLYQFPSSYSKSGTVRMTWHPDDYLLATYGERPAVLVTDPNTAGVYDTVYVDLDDDYDFSDEKPVTKSSPGTYRDMNGDGYTDISGGLLAFISDGSTLLPGGIDAFDDGTPEFADAFTFGPGEMLMWTGDYDPGIAGTAR